MSRPTDGADGDAGEATGATKGARPPAAGIGGGGWEEYVEFRSRDGTGLNGTMRMVPGAQAGALLVHGLTGNREENGLYGVLAGMLEHGSGSGSGSGRISSFRFDMRGHGRSGGRYEDMTMSGVVGDIAAAYGRLTARLPSGAPIFVVASSFGGGMAVYWAAATAPVPHMSASASWMVNPMLRGSPLGGIVLLNPLFDCCGRMLLDKPYWNWSGLADDAIGMLARRGWLEHDGGFRIGIAMYNELFCVRPQDRVGEIDAPLLTIHGDADSVASHNVSRACTNMAKDSEFLSIHGADHGFVHPDDVDGTHPDTRRLRDAALSKAALWISARHARRCAGSC